MEVARALKGQEDAGQGCHVEVARALEGQGDVCLKQNCLNKEATLTDRYMRVESRRNINLETNT